MRPGHAATPSGLGGFVNYDLNWQRDGATRGGVDSANQRPGRVGVFNANGNGRASGYWRGGGMAQAFSGDCGNGLVRLDGTWNIDSSQAPGHRTQAPRRPIAIVLQTAPRLTDTPIPVRSLELISLDSPTHLATVHVAV